MNFSSRRLEKLLYYNSHMRNAEFQLQNILLFSLRVSFFLLVIYRFFFDNLDYRYVVFSSFVSPFSLPLHACHFVILPFNITLYRTQTYIFFDLHLSPFYVFLSFSCFVQNITFCLIRSSASLFLYHAS